MSMQQNAGYELLWEHEASRVCSGNDVFHRNFPPYFDWTRSFIESPSIDTIVLINIPNLKLFIRYLIRTVCEKNRS